MTLIKRHFGKLAVLMITAMIALCIAPAMALAAPNVTVSYEGNYPETIDLATIAQTTEDNYGYQFKKSDVWNVIGTDNFVTFTDLKNAYVAAVDDDYGSTEAAAVSSAWIANGAYLTFTTPDFPVLYDKYNSGIFPISALEANLFFYRGTVYNNGLPLPTSPLTSVVPAPAILALESETTTQSASSGDAGYVLDNLTVSSTADAPRLLWGFEDENPSAVGGNRFPSNVTTITIH